MKVRDAYINKIGDNKADLVPMERRSDHLGVTYRNCPARNLTSTTTNLTDKRQVDQNVNGQCQISSDLILIRGFPGSGKTTHARLLTLAGYQHFEADMYFVHGDIYHYDAAQIEHAHSWCKRMTKQALKDGAKVVVSNTFIRLSEMEAYFAMTNNVHVIEAKGHWQNQHGVSTETLKRMTQRWEAMGILRFPNH